MTHTKTAESTSPKNGTRITKFVALAAAAVATSLLLVSAGCGSSSHNLSTAQAQAVSSEMSTALQAALSASLTADSSTSRHGNPSLSTILSKVHNDQESGCTVNDSGESCNIPVSYTGNCPGGGTIGISGDFDYTLNTSGSGSDSSTLTITPTNCSVSSETINGNPNVTVATQINFTNDAPVFPITLTETGGISFGPNPSGSCTVNVTYTVNSTSCTASGTICGQSISGSC